MTVGSQPISRPDGAQPRVLVVDDEAYLSELLAMALRYEGWDVRTAADGLSAEDIVYPRVHPAPMETCGCVADYERVEGKLTLWTTSQAPHAHRTVYAPVSGLPEHKIRVIAPDIGGGFGNKVPIYPGYVCAIVGSLLPGKPVKWVEDRSENLVSTGFARDYIMRGEIAATKEGKILAIRTNVLADHGACNGTAAPIKYPAGFFGVFTGSYDIEAAFCLMTAVYTNKAPGGVAYACSFRITEAVYLVERIVDCLAYELQMDPAELRIKNFIQPDQFPYTSKTGWSTTPATTSRRCAWRWRWPATTNCAASRPKSASVAS